jgi:hypothetical protein
MRVRAVGRWAVRSGLRGVCGRGLCAVYRGLGWLSLFDYPNAGWLAGGRCVGWAGCLVCLCRALCVCVSVCLCLVVAVGRSLGWLCVVVAGCVWLARCNRAVCLFWGCRGWVLCLPVNGRGWLSWSLAVPVCLPVCLCACLPVCLCLPVCDVCCLCVACVLCVVCLCKWLAGCV